MTRRSNCGEFGDGSAALETHGNVALKIKIIPAKNRDLAIFKGRFLNEISDRFSEVSAPMIFCIEMMTVRYCEKYASHDSVKSK